MLMTNDHYQVHVEKNRAGFTGSFMSKCWMT